ncbi:hypothetical protein PG993_011808 [Apiospora rasikravindrae]|uniref:Uncharacterized protein n=1 Tax=Apiospora rasikravindrae TaxID=990691 RepID=A0ABR1S0M5_9PEZI
MQLQLQLLLLSKEQTPDFGTKLVRSTLDAFEITTIDIVINNTGLWPAPTRRSPTSAWVPGTPSSRPTTVQAALPYIQPSGRFVHIGRIIAKIGHRVFTVTARPREP